MGPGVRRDDERTSLGRQRRRQPFFALFGGGAPNSFFKSSMLCDNRGHSQEKAFLAQFEALMRAACLTGLATGTGTFSVSVRSATCCTLCCDSCWRACLAVKAAAM